MNDFSIIIQGPQIKNSPSLNSLKYYKSIGEIIISYWITDEADCLAGIDLENIKIIQNKVIDNSVYNVMNIYKQCISTLNGLRLSNTEFSIKTRSDQGYNNLSPLVEKIIANPDKLITGNMFFARHDHKKFHISDQLIGGRTKTLIGTFEILKNRLENLFVAAEQLIFSSFIMHQNETLDVEKAEQIVKKWIEIVPVSDLGLFGKWAGSGQDYVKSVADVFTDYNFKNHYVEWNKSRSNFIKDYFGQEFFRDKKITEFGCGYADVGASFLSLGADVTGIDARQEHLKKAQQAHPNIKVIQFDLDSSVWPDLRCDIALFLGVLYHLRDPEMTLNNLCKCADLIILETEVVDTKDDQKIVLKKERGFDQAFNETGSRVSRRFVERVMEKNGFKCELIKDARLNAAFHRYDWEEKFDNSYRDGLRRFWICKKTI